MLVTISVDTPCVLLLCKLSIFKSWLPLSYCSSGSSRINTLLHLHTRETKWVYLRSTNELLPKCRSQKSRKWIPRANGKIWIRMCERGPGRMNTPEILISIKLQKHKQSSLTFPPTRLGTNVLTASFHFFALAPRHLLITCGHEVSNNWKGEMGLFLF